MLIIISLCTLCACDYFINIGDPDVGADVGKCMEALAPKHSAKDIKRSIDHLSAQGLIYSTIDDTKYMYAE